MVMGVKRSKKAQGVLIFSQNNFKKPLDDILKMTALGGI